MAMNIPYHEQWTHYKSSLASVPEHTTRQHARWSAPPSTNMSPSYNTNASPQNFLLPASLPERADAMLSKSLLEQCRLESSSRDTSPRSSLNNHYSCGSWKSRAAGGGADVLLKPSSTSVTKRPRVISLPCSTESLKEGPLLRGRFSKRNDTPISSPDRRKSALSAALSSLSCASSTGQVDLKFIGARFAQQRNYHPRGAPRRNVGEPSMSSSATPIPTNRFDKRDSSFSERTSPCSSASSSLTTDSSQPYLPRYLSGEEQKKELLDRLMGHFFTLLASKCRRRVAAGSASSSHDTSPTSSTSSSFNDGNTQLCDRRPVTKEITRRRRMKRAADREEDSDDEDDSPRRSKPKMPKTEEIETRRLACPFFKHNPHRFKEERSCVGPGWMTVHRVKEHIYRVHTLPIHCLRCHDQFASEDLLRVHSQAVTPCQVRPAHQNDNTSHGPEGIGLSQERNLRSRKRVDKTEEEKWADVYRICFPDDTTVPNPYFEIPASAQRLSEEHSSEFERCEAFMRQELPGRVRGELEIRIERALVPVEESLKHQLGSIVQDLQVKLFEEFKQASRRGDSSRTNQNSVISSTTAAKLPPDTILIGVNPLIQNNGTVPLSDNNVVETADMGVGWDVSRPMDMAFAPYPFIMEDPDAFLDNVAQEGVDWDSRWMDTSYSSWM